MHWKQLLAFFLPKIYISERILNEKTDKKVEQLKEKLEYVFCNQINRWFSSMTTACLPVPVTYNIEFRFKGAIFVMTVSKNKEYAIKERMQPISNSIYLDICQRDFDSNAMFPLERIPVAMLVLYPEFQAYCLNIIEEQIQKNIHLKVSFLEHIELQEKRLDQELNKSFTIRIQK